jgi:general secretion pathway protein F
MARLAEEAERRDQLRKKVTTAMVYPSVILLVSLGVLVALMTGVVPQLVSLFEGMKQELPPLTLAVIAISDAFQTQGLLWLALLIALGFGWVRLGRIEKVKAWQERFLLHLPLFGKILKHQAASQLLRTLGMLHQSGTPMVDALDITAKVLDYSLHKKAIREARNRVQEGQSLFRAMEKQQLMSSMSLYMLASGEKSSRLSEMLFEAAKQEEDQLQNHITQLMALVEPVMILVMGGLVFVILMAVMLPIFELNQAVG